MFAFALCLLVNMKSSIYPALYMGIEKRWVCELFAQKVLLIQSERTLFSSINSTFRFSAGFSMNWMHQSPPEISRHWIENRMLNPEWVNLPFPVSSNTYIKHHIYDAHIGFPILYIRQKLTKMETKIERQTIIDSISYQRRNILNMTALCTQTNRLFCCANSESNMASKKVEGETSGSSSNSKYKEKTKRKQTFSGSEFHIPERNSSKMYPSETSF